MNNVKLVSDMILSYSLFITCPKCNFIFDLFKCDSKSIFHRAIFNSRVSNTENIQVSCPHCKETFYTGKII